jgi:transposase
MREELKTAHQKIDHLQAEAEKSKQEWLDQSLKDQLHRLQRKFYGFGREENPNQAARPIGHQEQVLLLHANHPQPEEETKPGSENPDESGTSKTLAKRHSFSDEDLEMESKSRGVMAGKEGWKEIPGLFQESSEITITERTYRKVLHQQAKYRLKDEYNTTGKEVIITAPGPAKIRPGSQYSIDFALSVVSDKYQYHLPLERQRRKMEEAGLQVEVKTLYGLCEAVAEHCNAVLPRIKKEIQNDYCAVHIDESPWRILREGTLGYLWVMSNRLGCYYQFEPSRSGKIAQEMMKDYDGAVVTDAYGGYNRLAQNTEIRMQYCWAHARREFYDRYDDFPTECGKAIEIIDQLFAVERKATSIESLKELRKVESPQIIGELRTFLFETKPRFLAGDGISKAIQYCLNQWTGLTHFLTDVTVPLTNNDAERALRHAVVGRKNFLGSQTINGADTAAMLYTVIETCKKNSTAPTEYLRYLITERWYDREPMTPKEYADKKLGVSTKIKWPERSEWQIK